MENDLRSIGEMARTSGLSVSALRFYDRAGVLVPAVVDPLTGYRWYAEHQLQPARLVAGLRRVGMPLPEISAAVRHRTDPAVVRRLLDGHLRRLEDGLADARRAFSRIHALLDHEEQSMTVTHLTLSRTGLAAALDAVRFAVGDDPELPVLAGVLFEVDPAAVRVVTTDRYRLAVAETAATVTGPTVSALAPVTFVDQLRELLDRAAGATPEVRLTVGTGGISVTVAGRTLDATPLPYDFPDYRRLLRRGTSAAPVHRVQVDVPALRAALTSGTAPTVAQEENGVRTEVTVLGIGSRGELRILGDRKAGDGATGDPATGDGATGDGDPIRVGVNAGYLVDALDALYAAGRGQLVLELDSPIAPLAVRLPDDDRSFSVLMPIRL